MRSLIIFCLLVCIGIGSGNDEVSQNFVTCTICEAVMKAVDESLVDPANEQAVADFLSQVCAYLGGQWETICIEFLGEYTDDIIDMLVNQYLNPDEICAAIGACP